MANQLDSVLALLELISEGGTVEKKYTEEKSVRSAARKTDRGAKTGAGSCFRHSGQTSPQ